MKKATIIVFLALTLSFFGSMPISHALYYCNIGRSNMEVGVHEQVIVEANKTYEFYVARIDSVGNLNMTDRVNNLNMTVSIKTNITFADNETTLKNVNLTTMNFIGKREYTYEQVPYPFFLVIGDQVQVWLNISLPKVGNYSFLFETDVQPIFPFNHTGPTSLNNEKFDAKLVCVTPASSASMFGYPPILLSIGLGIPVLTAILAYALRRHIRQMLTGKKKTSRKDYMRKYMSDRRRKQREAKTQPE